MIRRVLEGGEGLIRGGNDEISSDSGICGPLGLDSAEVGGDIVPDAIMLDSELAHKIVPEVIRMVMLSRI